MRAGVRGLVVTGVLGTALAAPAAAGGPAATAFRPASPADVAPSVPGGSVLVLGVPGLRWDDLSPPGTPQLWKLAGEGATGAMVVRGADETTTTADGWGTLSAGNRVRVPGGLADVPPPPGPAVTPAGYPGMDALRRAQAPTHTGAEPGALGQAVRRGARCTTAAGGPGALLGAADSAGRVDGYGADTPEHPCPLTVAEPDVPAGTAPGRLLAAADALAGRLAALLGPDDTLLVLGVGDSPGSGPGLHVAIAVGPAFPAGTELTSASTRRVPFVQLVDAAPTVLDRLGIDVPASMTGQPWSTGGDAGSLASRQARYEDADLAARQVHRAVPLVVAPLVATVTVLLLVAAGLVFAGARTSRNGLGRAGRRLARATAYAWAAAPAAAFLANLVPWWRAPLPVVLVVVAAADALVLAVALTGPWRRSDPLGPFTAIVVGTFGLLVVDLLTGAHLQLSGILGYEPLVGGRFAGLGNRAFGALAASAVLTATLLAVRLPRPALVVGIVGTLAVVVDGAAQFGADAGGVLALAPALLLLGLAAAGRRPTWRQALVALGLAVAVLVVFAAVDLARPAGSRTHLGRFASDLLIGHAGETLHRRWEANMALLTRNVATLLVLPVVAALTVVLLRAGRMRGTAPLARALARVPLLRDGLLACVLAGVLGFLVNDSGIVVPAVMLGLGVPAGVLAATDAHLAAEPTSVESAGGERARPRTRAPTPCR